jgi:hypothetical protein
LSPSIYADLIPRSAGEAASALYQTEIAAVLEILGKELAGQSEFPKAKKLEGGTPSRSAAR